MTRRERKPRRTVAQKVERGRRIATIARDARREDRQARREMAYA